MSPGRSDIATLVEHPSSQVSAIRGGRRRRIQHLQFACGAHADDDAQVVRRAGNDLISGVVPRLDPERLPGSQAASVEEAEEIAASDGLVFRELSLEDQDEYFNRAKESARRAPRREGADEASE